MFTNDFEENWQSTQILLEFGVWLSWKSVEKGNIIYYSECGMRNGNGGCFGGERMNE